MISAQEEWRQPGTGAWLEGAEERFVIKTKASQKPKKKIHHTKPISQILRNN